MYCNINGVWRNNTEFSNIGGIWKTLSPYCNVNGVWKDGRIIPKLSFKKNFFGSTYGYMDITSSYVNIASGFTGIFGQDSAISTIKLDLRKGDIITVQTVYTLSNKGPESYWCGRESSVYLSTSESPCLPVEGREYVIYRSQSDKSQPLTTHSYTIPNDVSGLYIYIQNYTFGTQGDHVGVVLPTCDTNFLVYDITINGKKIFS